MEVVALNISAKFMKKALIFLLALLLTFGVIFFCHRRQATSSKAVLAAYDAQSDEAKALVYLLLDAIAEQTVLFYEPYYTIPPTVSYYSTYVKAISEHPGHIEITFCSLPYIGPHDSIGEDELTFQVRSNGEVIPLSFHHLKSDPLPDNLLSLQKELPPQTEKR